MLAALLACDGTLPEASAELDTCNAYIRQPMSAFDDSLPEPADPHAEVYGPGMPVYVHLTWPADPSTSVAALWLSGSETLASQVQFGPDFTYGTTVDGASFLFATGDADGRVHEVHLCGLEPATTYHYRVGGESHWSGDRTFTTAPSPGTAAPFSFGVMGDSRDGQDIMGALFRQMDAQAPDFYATTGDMVGSGADVDEWKEWFAWSTERYSYRPIVPVQGNHEFHAQPFYALIALPGNEQWYSFDYANAHFVILSDTQAKADDLEIQADWLAEDLAASDQDWKIVMHHRPAWSSSDVHGSDAVLQDLWSPIEEFGDVRLDLAGHDHAYERFVPLKGGMPFPGGTTYVVTGGAGAPLYSNVGALSNSSVVYVGYHYVVVAIDGTRMVLTAYDLAGNVLDVVEFGR